MNDQVSVKTSPRSLGLGCGLSLLILGGCATGGSEQQGNCLANTCTGVCQNQVEEFAQNKLGSAAQDVYFDWEGTGGAVGSSEGVVYFTTAACTSGKYQLKFYGNRQTCSNVFYGRPPDFIGDLMVVPEGCPGKR